MTATTTTDQTAVQPSTTSVSSFTDWKPPEEREPTQAEEQEARERTLEIGNITEIHWKKAPIDRRDYYKRLDDHNRDCWWKFRDEIDLSYDCDNEIKRHILFAFAGELGLNQYQRRKALNHLFRLDLPKFGMRTDVVAFCLCALVLKSEAKRYGDDGPYNPHRGPENNKDRFVSVESQLIETRGRTNKTYIQKTWGKLIYGNPPSRCDEEWKPFVQSLSKIQTHPSHQPDHVKL